MVWWGLLGFLLFFSILLVWSVGLAVRDAMSHDWPWPMTKKKRRAHPGEPDDPIYKEGLTIFTHPARIGSQVILNPKRPKPPVEEEPLKA